jgi:hypothetical protein
MDKSQAGKGQTFAGIVEGGLIRLNGNVRLPEKTRVLVVVEDWDLGNDHRVSTPRLADKTQADDFKLEVFEGRPDAGI